MAVDPTDVARWQRRRVVAWGRLLIPAVVLAMLVALGRVVQLEIAPDPRMLEAMGTTSGTRQELARRGDIVDRRGRLLAASTVGYRLFIDPEVVDDPMTIALDVSALVGLDPADIDRRLAMHPDSRFVVVDDLLEDWQVDAVRAANLRGVGLADRLVRHYPAGGVAAMIVGTVGFEHSGLSGLELRLNERMNETPGRLEYRRDSKHRPVWFEPSGYRSGEDGGAVRLTIDLVLQSYVEQRLAQAVEHVNAGGGRMVVLDCRTGEILAMHDLLRARADWDEQTEDPMRAQHPALGRNRCASDPYEPGSTFKPFVWSTALDLGRIDETTPFDTPKSGYFITSYGRGLTDVHPTENATAREVLIQSLNSGMAIIAERLSHQEVRAALDRFCIGRRTNAGIPGESAGIVTSAKNWSKYSQTSVAMGHEIAVTPLQMVRAFSAFARDGTVPIPRVVAGERFEITRRAISASSAQRTRAVLRDVMREGSAQRIASKRYSMFGKSGTAQLPKKDGSGYHDRRYVSSFIAGAPFDDPRIVVLCVIDDPDRAIAHYGTQVAGPVVSDVVDATLQYLGVRPDLEVDARLAHAR